MTTTEANNFLAALAHIEALNRLISEICESSDEVIDAVELAQKGSDISTFQTHEGVEVDDLIMGGTYYRIDEMKAYLRKKIWAGETID